jgi:predicted PurR-regulated permease PerM
VVALICVLFYSFQSVLTPFLLGALIAYLLTPLIEPLEGIGAPRWLSSLGVLVLFFLGVTIGLVVVIPMIADEINEFAQNIPHFVEQGKAMLAPYMERLAPYIERFNILKENGELETLAAQHSDKAANIGKLLMSSLLAGTQNIIGFVSLFFLTPIVAFYMMADWPRLTQIFKDLLPKPSKDTITDLMSKMDKSLAGFIRGQLSVCLILGVAYGIALSLMGLKFGFVIGLVSGVFSFIPFVGSAFGLIASVSVAWFQFGTLAMVGLAFAIFVVGQMIEGNILTPKLVGESIQLHPLWIIFAIMAGGSLMGFSGMLIALPVAAISGVLVRFFIQRYKDTYFYTGDSEKKKEAQKPAPQKAAPKKATPKKTKKAAT